MFGKRRRGAMFNGLMGAGGGKMKEKKEKKGGVDSV